MKLNKKPLSEQEVLGEFMVQKSDSTESCMRASEESLKDDWGSEEDRCYDERKKKFVSNELQGSKQTNIEEEIAWVEKSLTKLAMGYMEFCKGYVERLDRCHDLNAILLERIPHVISKRDLIKFEKVGRGLMHWKLLEAQGNWARRLEKCSVSEQFKYLEQGKSAELLTANGDVLNVDIKDLLPDQIRQIFHGDHVRTLSEQRVYIENLKTNKMQRVDCVSVVKYKIDKKKKYAITGPVPTIFTLSDALKLVKELSRV